MKIENWFELAVRIIGLVVLLYGMGYLLDALLFQQGYFNYPESSPRYYVVAGLCYFFVGFYLMRGAPRLVSFAYPRELEDESREDVEDAKKTDSND